MSSLTRLACCSRLLGRLLGGRCMVAIEKPLACSSFTSVHSPLWQNTRSYATKPDQEEHTKNFKWPFHMTMSTEQKTAKEKRIAEMKSEEPPASLFAKVKYYLKRYWYIAVPAHAISCTAWFIALYFLVKSGVDVIALLKFLHMPEYIVEKVQNTPPSAGVAVVALILYKIAIPLRYATTLLLIQLTFNVLRRMGKLRTVREVEYRVRSEYEKQKHLYGRKLYRFRHLGVRDVARKNSAGQAHSQQKTPPPPGKKE